MRGRGVLSVAMLALIALGAVGTTSASATAPEFGRCVKVPKGTGEYATAKCTEAGGEDKFEWSPGPGANRHFQTAIKAETLVTLEFISGPKVICQGETGKGEVSGAKSVSNVELLFTKCESGVKCFNQGLEGEGQIAVKGLSGTLGVIQKGETPLKDRIGIDLSSVRFSFACLGNPVEVRGSVIFPVKSNAMVLRETAKFSQTKGKQKPERFEGEPIDVLEGSLAGSAFQQIGLGLTMSHTNEERIEVNSVV